MYKMDVTLCGTRHSIVYNPSYQKKKYGDAQMSLTPFKYNINTFETKTQYQSMLLDC